MTPSAMSAAKCRLVLTYCIQAKLLCAQALAEAVIGSRISADSLDPRQTPAGQAPSPAYRATTGLASSQLLSAATGITCIWTPMLTP